MHALNSIPTSLRIGLIYNPLGGLARKHHHAISAILTELPILQWQISTIDDFDTAVNALIQTKIEWLIIIGGDGTIQGIFTRIFSRLPPNEWPSISIIPGGTTNMTAFDLGVHEKPNLILERLKQHLIKTANIPTSLKAINKAVMRIEQTGQPTLYGMFLGLGLIARGVKFSRSRIKQIGITGNIFTTIIVLRSLIGTFLGRPHPTWAPVHIMLPYKNEASSSQPYLLAMISTLDHILMGIHPYWGQERAPLHTTFVAQHCTRFWLAMLQIILKQGQSLKKEHGYLSYNTESLELLLDDEYIVDGELFHASSQQGPLKISAKEMVKFLIL